MWLAAINRVGNPGRLNTNNPVQSKHLPLNTKHKLKNHTKSAQMAQKKKKKKKKKKKNSFQNVFTIYFNLKVFRENAQCHIWLIAPWAPLNHIGTNRIIVPVTAAAIMERKQRVINR
jgi:hypothetical protein